MKLQEQEQEYFIIIKEYEINLANWINGRDWEIGISEPIYTNKKIKKCKYVNYYFSNTITTINLYLNI
jgi:hypothetical protein